jgi:hypothetical protein
MAWAISLTLVFMNLSGVLGTVFSVFILSGMH